MIALLLAPLYLLLNFYILRWLFFWAEACHGIFKSRGFRYPVAFLYGFLTFSPLSGFLITASPWRRIVRILSNYWLGTFFYILFLVLVFDFLRWITKLPVLLRYRYVSLLHSKRKTLFYSGCCVLVLVCVSSAYGILHARRLYVREYPVILNKDCDLPSLKIALIADLHLGYSTTKEQIQELTDAINLQNPDLICIAGDIFDNEYDAIENPEAVASILSRLTSRYGTYACYGNHDISEKILAGFTFSHKGEIPEDPRFRRFLKSAGIELLEDQVITIDNAFYLAGRKDPSLAKKEQGSRLSFSELSEGLDPSMPLLVMDHQPKELSEAAAAGVDLDLSGHTHGGQFFPGNLIMKFLWENPCGIQKKDSMYSVVTSGVGVWGPAMRIGTDSEVVILDVEFRDQGNGE